MPRPVTLFTGQWADLPLEDLARKAHEFGYQGLELACWGTTSMSPVQSPKAATARPSVTALRDRKSTRLNSSHQSTSRMPSSA